MGKEYIEREALLADIEACVRITSRPDHPSAELRGANKVISRIKAIPAADVVPVRNGRWMEHKSWAKCSECGYLLGFETPYCPNCGARMDGDGDV